MYWDNKTISLIAMIVVGFGATWLFFDHSGHQTPSIESIESIGPSSAPSAETGITFAEVAAEAREALGADNIPQAIEVFNAWEGPIPLGEDRDRLSPAITGAMDRLLDRLATGEGNPEHVDDLLRDFDGIKISVARALLDERRDAVLQARLPHVRHFMRITSGPHPTYSEPIEQALLGFIELPKDKVLIDHKGFTHKERPHHWKALYVQVKETTARYEFSEKYQHHGSATLPESVTLSFQMTTGLHTTDVTTWDDLPDLMVTVDLPEDYLFEFENDRQKADLSRQEQKAREALLQAAIAELAKLPPFEVLTPATAGAAEPR